jgi:glycosyltransferase involved in cell wall biosynthesis
VKTVAEASARRQAPSQCASATPAGSSAIEYALVHLVAQESFEELIEAQVLEPMIQQVRLGGRHHPRHVIVGFLEAARVALGRRHRRRMRVLRERSTSITLTVLPFASRLGTRMNAWLLAKRLRQLTGGIPVVLHCRGESATAWGVAISRELADAAVVSDVRGIWPDEMLLRRGFRAVEVADPKSRRDYESATERVRAGLRGADAVLAVSNPLAEWLARVGVSPEQVVRVPCCVSEISYSLDERVKHRAELGLTDRLVMAYLGGVASYQHLEDGLVPFTSMALALDPDVHLLCLTNDPGRFRDVLTRGGVIDAHRVTVMRLPQRDVAKVLTAADAGFLLREPNEVNRVAMPVKVAEYLSSGVPLVTSRVAGWVDELVDAYNAGVVVDWFGCSADEQAREVRRVIRVIRDRRSAMREGALRLCRERFLWSHYLPAVREAYQAALRRVALRNEDEERRGSNAATVGIR